MQTHGSAENRERAWAWRPVQVLLLACLFAGFLLAHGTPAAMAFRLRSEKTTDGIRSLTEHSRAAPRADDP